MRPGRCPGVVAVFTAADLNIRLGKLWHTMVGPEAPMPPIRPLAEGDVRFVGDPVALVVAESRYAAEDAAELVELEIDPLDVVVDAAAALSDAAPIGASRARVQPGGGGAQPAGPRGGGGVRRCRRDGDGNLLPTPLQLRADGAARPDRRLGSGQQSLTIHSSTQGPHEVRANMSRLLQIPEDRIRVVMGDVGGAFGQKMFPMREDFAVVGRDPPPRPARSNGSRTATRTCSPAVTRAKSR